MEKIVNIKCVCPKMMFKSVLLVLLISLLFMCATACAESPDGGTVDTDDTVAAAVLDDLTAADSEDEEIAVDIMTLVPEQDLGGFEMRFLTDRIWDWDFGPFHMMYIEELTGEPVYDAIYRRNAIVEERLNIRISEVVSTNNQAKDTIRRLISAGDDEFDVVIAESWNIGAQLAANGLLVNLKDVGLQLDAPWWDQASIRDYAIGDRLYFMTGDHNLISDDATWVLFFNKQMTLDLGLELPYGLVREGRWTFDAQMEYMRMAKQDLTGDPVWTYEDIWGQVTHTQHYTGLLIAAGENLITRDSDGLPVFGQVSDRFHRVYEKIQEMMKTPGYTHNIHVPIPRAPGHRHATYNFLANSALFCPEILAHTRRFRQMENDFGILPHPKFDEHQERYYSYVLGQVTVTTIPITNSNIDYTAIVLDALGMLSSHTTIPAYYEVSLVGKFFRDDDSGEMLDIIRANRVFGTGDAWGWGGVTGAFQGAARDAQPMTSFIERQERVITRAIERTLEAFFLR